MRLSSVTILTVHSLSFQVVELARQEFQSGKTTDIEFRKTNLRQLLRFYQENEAELAQAVYADLRKVRHKENWE